MQPDVIKYNLIDRTFYFDNLMPGNIITRVVKALGLIVRNFNKKPSSLLKSLNFIRFGKEAFSLKLLYSIIPFLGRGPYEFFTVISVRTAVLGVSLGSLGIFKEK